MGVHFDDLRTNIGCAKFLVASKDSVELDVAQRKYFAVTSVNGVILFESHEPVPDSMLDFSSCAAQRNFREYPFTLLHNQSDLVVAVREKKKYVLIGVEENFSSKVLHVGQSPTCSVFLSNESRIVKRCLLGSSFQHIGIETPSIRVVSDAP